MKRIALVALLPFLFVACAKEEITNEGFRPPTCADTSDDGKFEKFTTSEAFQFLRFNLEVPEVEDPSALAFKYITSRELFNRSVIFDPILVFKRNRPLQFHMYMQYRIIQENYYSWTSLRTDTAGIDTINIHNLRQLGLQPGCYRLYYVFSDTTSRDSVHGKVLTKGHYDIEVKN